MDALVALGISLAAVPLLRTPLMRAPGFFYALAIAACFMSLVRWWPTLGLPWAESISFSYMHGSFAYFLFAFVMYIGLLPQDSRAYHYLIPIRGKLSIVASLLAGGHFAGYLLAFVSGFLVRSVPAAPRTLLAFLFALAIFILLVPLAITSLTAVRNSMNSESWKRLQKTAYVFFAFVFVHVVVMLGPLALRGGDALVRFACYVGTFVPYVIFFIRQRKWR